MLVSVRVFVCARNNQFESQQRVIEREREKRLLHNNGNFREFDVLKFIYFSPNTNIRGEEEEEEEEAYFCTRPNESKSLFVVLVSN